VRIHLVFDTSAVMREFPDLRDQFRPAYTRLWEQMAAEIVRVFPQDIEPDRTVPASTCKGARNRAIQSGWAALSGS
jgi:hypothetical protein